MNIFIFLKLIIYNIYLNYFFVIFLSSLSIEDILIKYIILKKKLLINIFTLNTYRLNKETLNIINYIKIYYKYNIFIYKIKKKRNFNFILQYGINNFYKNINLRKKCCFIRKVFILNKILNKNNFWITGQRKEYSKERLKLKFKEKNFKKNTIKFNPLFKIKLTKIFEYLNKKNILYNILYKKKYTSIGCSPCTKINKFKKNIRYGRWWWEKSNIKECGLHI